MDATSISQLDDPAFRNLITENIHAADNNEDVWKILTSPDLVDRTHNTLQDLRKQTEASLGKRRRDLEDFRAECYLRGASGKQDFYAAKADYQEWKRRANSFRYMVEARQAQARAALKSALAAAHEENSKAARPPSRKRVAYHDALRDLVIAVHRHQATWAASGRLAEQQDYELWRHLDAIRVPVVDSDDASLRDMLLTFWADTEIGADEGSRRHERLMKQAPAGRSATFEGTTKARHLGSNKPLADD